MYVVLNEFLQKTKYSTVKALNVRFKLRLLATSIFSLTFTCVRKQHNCEKNEAHGQRDVALVRHLGSTEGTLFCGIGFYVQNLYVINSFIFLGMQYASWSKASLK